MSDNEPKTRARPPASSEGRRFERVPVMMEVGYRTTGSFLVSYSMNLSQGGLFLETSELLPVGTRLAVRFTVPGAEEPVETQARVMWLRENAGEGGYPPAGLGLCFEKLEERIGTLIDDLARGFAGLRLIAIAGDQPTIERVTRYLRGTLACDLIAATDAAQAERAFAEGADLALLDLDSLHQDGVGIVRAARTAGSPVPIVVLSRGQYLGQRATEAGAAAVLDNPPPFDRLRRCILEVLGKPSPRRLAR